MLIYSESNPNFCKYGALKRGGFVIRVIVGDTDEDLFLEGVKTSCTVQELQDVIEKEIGVHHTRQRLFIGGEEMPQSGTLSEYFPTAHAANAIRTINLRCYVPLLISTLRCPGPMLAEIEVRPQNDEPVIAVKRRIRDKFRIEVSKQRLHLHPCQMTSYFLRRPLDDTRLLSAYLSPSAGGNFLELIVVDKVEQTSYNECEFEIYVRIPHEVCNASKFVKPDILKFSQVLHCHPSSSDDNTDHRPENFLSVKETPPPPPPQTPESDINKDEKTEPGVPLAVSATRQLELWWVTIPVQIGQIIKRDPTVRDIKRVINTIIKDKKLLSMNENIERESVSKNNERSPLNMLLKYCNVKLSKGGKVLNENQCIYKDLLMRREDMLLYISQQNYIQDNINYIPKLFFGNAERLAPNLPIIPISPLESYDDELVLFSSPPDPVVMRWKINSSNVIDKGADPMINLELTGLSYTRKYGSWDIPEHEKTYVEVIIEGSSSVGDLGYSDMIEMNTFKGFENLDHDKEMLKRRNSISSCDDYSQRVVYYVQDAVEITIYGPFDPSVYKPFQTSLSKPFGNSEKEFVAERKKLFEFHQEIRRGELKNPPMPHPAPFYMRVNEKHVEKSSSLSKDIIQSWKDRRQLNKNAFNQWCVSREKITDIGVANETTPSLKAFATHCTRGTSKDGRPYVKVLYERRFPAQSKANVLFPRKRHVDSVRNTFDFRIQAQFHISQLLESSNKLGNSADFKISARHWITRIEHCTHVPDDCSQHASPNSGMDTILTVDLANENWLKLTQKQIHPTTELQKMSC